MAAFLFGNSRCSLLLSSPQYYLQCLQLQATKKSVSFWFSWEDRAFDSGSSQPQSRTSQNSCYFKEQVWKPPEFTGHPWSLQRSLQQRKVQQCATSKDSVLWSWSLPWYWSCSREWNKLFLDTTGLYPHGEKTEWGQWRNMHFDIEQMRLGRREQIGKEGACRRIVLSLHSALPLSGWLWHTPRCSNLQFHTREESHRAPYTISVSFPSLPKIWVWFGFTLQTVFSPLEVHLLPRIVHAGWYDESLTRLGAKRTKCQSSTG